MTDETQPTEPTTEPAPAVAAVEVMPPEKPLKRDYTHKACDKSTHIGNGRARSLRDHPKLCIKLWCAHCADEFDRSEFKWTADGSEIE